MSSRATSLTARLTAQRLTPAAWAELAADRVLGGLVFGSAPGFDDGLASAAVGRVIPSDGPMIDAWLSDGPFERGSSGQVRWVGNGQWLFGALDVDEAANGNGLERLAALAYRDLFDTLARTPCQNLLRLWNYVPGINAEASGMERYRQFNAGRQQAFLEAGRAAFDGAPAACALGTRDGPLRVRFLAGRSAALPIENPRQVSAYHYPSEYGPRSPTFSRAALTDAGGGQLALLISGTSSIVGHETVHAGDVGAQTQETLTNLNAVIGAAKQRCDAPFSLSEASCTVYTRRGADAATVRDIFDAAVGADSPAARSVLIVEADICRSDLQVEIEAQLFAPGKVFA